MTHFWSSTNNSSYIEPKREFQLIGIIDFIQPFLIQKMDKPTVTVETVKAKKFLKNGTIRVENHYKTDYKLNTITISAIDAYDNNASVTRDGSSASRNSSLNKATTLYEILTNGGYTATSNDIGSSRSALRFSTFSILEIRPKPVNSGQVTSNVIASGIGGASSAIIGSALNGGLSGFGAATQILEATAASLNFLDPFVAGAYTLQNPVITSVDFGSGINYTSDNFVQVSFSIEYNNFKYEQPVY